MAHPSADVFRHIVKTGLDRAYAAAEKVMAEYGVSLDITISLKDSAGVLDYGYIDDVDKVWVDFRLSDVDRTEVRVVKEFGEWQPDEPIEPGDAWTPPVANAGDSPSWAELHCPITTTSVGMERSLSRLAAKIFPPAGVTQ